MIGSYISVSPEILIISVIVVGIFLLLSLVAMAFMYNHFHQILAQQEEIISAMQTDLNAMCSGAVGVGEHLTKLDVRMRAVMQRQDELESQEAPERSYKYAIKMLRNGANLDQIIADCGLARGEAELLMLNKSIDQFNSQSKY
jgi:ABC-type siderophore export system fused ATPase/permease subunit